MSSDHYRTLLEEVRRDRAKAEADVAKLRDLEAYLAPKAGELAIEEPKAGAAGSPGWLADANPRNGRGRQPASPGGDGSLVDKAAVVLLKEGKPMRGAEITRKLEEQGVTTTARDGLIAMVLSVLRRRRDLFNKVDRGTYQLTEKGVNHARVKAGQ